VRRLDVDEVDLDAVDLGRELRERVEPCLELAEVVVLGPVRASSFIVANWTPWERSSTSSLLGQRVAAMRRRRSSICSSRISEWKGRIVLMKNLLR
jgi:hypothetical protein